ncbi:GNAT family N-acetyltransferase [Candidatus Uabimicrobium amorphum]|uniref:N-acetyltransferase n=1 Tax=Uabimicrobium amorphum TaxID=2596890 RepID=A0A5S9IVI6_UABAM|nr:GNAT family N-acetyltransferase [Candidatus Uabimicrobium amorphum]BBM87870.1 N-acetyltransferase [Candidatus Uabimicrobium amorphum]
MYRFAEDLESVPWEELCDLYEKTDLGQRNPTELQQAFSQSSHVVLVYQDAQIVGGGRAISDGVYYSGIFDIAVLPEHQGKGLGREIMNRLLAKLNKQFIVLTTTVGKEEFYGKLGFRKHKTAMAIYPAHKQKSAKLYLED